MSRNPLSRQSNVDAISSLPPSPLSLSLVLSLPYFSARTLRIPRDSRPASFSINSFVLNLPSPTEKSPESLLRREPRFQVGRPLMRALISYDHLARRRAHLNPSFFAQSIERCIMRRNSRKLYTMRLKFAGITSFSHQFVQRAMKHPKWLL